LCLNIYFSFASDSGDRFTTENTTDMKGILITILIAVSYTANIYGKNNDVIPRLAVKTLSGIYPMAEDIIWFKKAGGDMEVRFSQHDQSYNLASCRRPI
jgi:hypothetical protein